MFYSIDLGGTFIKFGIVENKKIIYKDKFLLEKLNLEEVLEKVSEILEKKSRNMNLKLEGVAISFPGIVDSINNKILSTNDKYSTAKNFDFTSWCKNKFNAKVKVENDAKMALLGEVYSGVAQNKKNVSLIIFGTGIGTAVFHNGEILKSRNFIAGNLGGHFSSKYFGRECTCGNLGCVEAYGSNWSIDGYIKENWDIQNSPLNNYKKIDYKAVIDEMKNCKIAKEIFEDLLNHWKNLISNMIYAYDSEAIILSGGLLNSKEFIIEPLKEHIKKLKWIPDGNEIELLCAENPDYSVLLGGEAIFKIN